MPHKGKPKVFEATADQRKLVELYTALGNTQEQVALLLGVSIDTLQRHFRDELNTGALRANAMIGGKLFNKALAGDNASIFFWLKTRARWRESAQQHEHSGPGGLPIETMDLTHLTDDELRQWQSIRAKINGDDDDARRADRHSG